MEHSPLTEYGPRAREYSFVSFARLANDLPNASERRCILLASCIRVPKLLVPAPRLRQHTSELQSWSCRWAISYASSLRSFLIPRNNLVSVTPSGQKLHDELVKMVGVPCLEVFDAKGTVPATK